MVGTLIKLTGIVPWVAYNLAVPTLFALTGAGAFSVAFSLADGDRATEFPGEEAPTGGLRIGSLLAGLAGGLLRGDHRQPGQRQAAVRADRAAFHSGCDGYGVRCRGLLNFLSGAVAVISGASPLQFPNDWWFWNASRVIPDTINEFPFFTFTYADLHAHMIALPLTLLALAAAVALVRMQESGVRSQESGVRSRRLKVSLRRGASGGLICCRSCCWALYSARCAQPTHGTFRRIPWPDWPRWLW